MMGLVNKSHVVDCELVVTAGAYSNGDVVGGLINLKDLCGSGGGGTIRSVRLVDADQNGNACRLYFFDEKPTEVADNAAVTGLGGFADISKLLGWLDVAASDWVAQDGVDIAWLDDKVITHGNGQLWAYLVVNDASPPTYSATTSLVLKVTGWLD